MRHATLKRRPRRLKPAEVIEADMWRQDLGRCTICHREGRACSGRVQGHHAIEKKTLKKHGLNEHVWDRRNRVPVCSHRHEEHTSAHRRIPRCLLPDSVFEFATELGLERYLELYPEDVL